VNILASYLPNLFSFAQGTEPSLTQTLYGQGGPKSSLSVSQALRSAELNQTRDVKVTAAQPEIKRATERFAAAVKSATSVTALLKSPAVMEVLLTANGLGDRISATALARKALTSDLTDPKSLANTLTDTRWKSVAKTFDFAAKGLAVIQKSEVIAKLQDAYAEVKWRQDLNKKTPGLSNALTFRAEASKITSVYQILGDPVLRDVVTTALSIPKQIAFQTLNAQEKAITTRLDITKLQDPKFVEKFVQRYLLNNASTAKPNTTDDLTTLANKASGLVI
jgi:hypothetical protein